MSEDQETTQPLSLASSPRPEIPDRFIFIHSYLDEAGLDPYEFRVLSHVGRRVGATYKEEFFASMKKSAAICQMSVRKMQSCLKILCEAGFLDKIQRDGRTDIYKLKHPKNWASSEQLATIRKKEKGQKSS
jgi:hypothetical protein